MRRAADVWRKAVHSSRGKDDRNSFSENELCEPVRAAVVRNETTPMWIRTTDRRIRNPMLYPAELWARVVLTEDQDLPVLQ